MTPWLLLSLFVSFAIGWLAVSLLWPDGGRTSKAQLPLKIFLGFGVGQGMTSCIAFLYLLINGRVDASYCLYELVVLACLLIIFYLKPRKIKAPPPAPELSRQNPSSRSALLAIAFYATASTALATIALKLWYWPHGGWDAWMTWNVRARAIFRGGDAWRDSFSSLVTNPDYPLLLPLSVVRAWTYAGSETTFVPAALSWLFTAATVGLVTSAVAALCGRAQGYVAGLVLLGYSFFVSHASSQLAEVPLMFFYAAALVLIAFHNEQPEGEGRGMLAVAGLVVGFAAWTKNEGLLFLFAWGIAHFAVVTHARGFRVYVKQALSLAAGLLPVLAVVVYFKTQIAPPTNLYISRMTVPQVSAQLMDVDRYVVIAREFARRFFLYEGLGISMPYMLLMLIVCFGITRKRIVSVAHGALMLTLMIAGFVWIYLATKADPAAVMRHSVDRVLVQMWPAFVFTFFLLAAPVKLRVADQPRDGRSAGNGAR